MMPSMTEQFNFPTACFVEDSETGEVLAVEHTVEYTRTILAFHQAECQHPITTPHRVPVANGSMQVRTCCVDCGARVGAALSQKDKAWVESLPWQPEENSATYKSRRDAEQRAILLDLARRQYAERGRFTKSYSEYMESGAWRAKRALVLKRCGNICEGCGVEKATEVHHDTYRHLFNEFLFELLGLCRACHERISAERRVELGPDQTFMGKEPDDEPC